MSIEFAEHAFGSPVLEVRRGDVNLALLDPSKGTLEVYGNPRTVFSIDQLREIVGRYDVCKTLGLDRALTDEDMKLIRDVTGRSR